MTKRLFIAPHYADVAFSCGGLIALDPANSIVSLVFSLKPEKDLIKKYEKYLFEIHRKPEKKYLKMFNLTSIDLKFPSALVRGRTPSDLFSIELTQIEKDLIFKIRDRLHEIIDRYNITEIYCPKDDRHQIDHYITKIAASKISREVHVFYYKDAPDFLPDEKDKSYEHLELLKINISKVLDQKIKAVSLYENILTLFFHSKERILSKMKKTPFEVYWKVKDF
ncbi:MAG: PIG-L deacetylase family protein [Candidatus Heimdallarchaeota archaeon]